MTAPDNAVDGAIGQPSPRRGQSSSRRFVSWAIVISLCGMLAYTIVAGPSGGPPVGQSAPEFTARLLGQSHPFEIGQLKGKTVLLDFWATWCPPCRKTLPVLQRLHRRYAQSESVAILSVNTDHEPPRIRRVSEFMAQNRYDFPVILDQGQVSSAYNVRSVPMVVIIDPQGLVREVEIGARRAGGNLESHLIEQIAAARDP